MQYIAISANSKHIDKILKKAKSLDLTVKDEISWDDGFKYSDKSNRKIKVFDYSEMLWTFLQELEPQVDLSKKSKLLGSHLTIPSAEEIVKLGY